MKIVIALQNLSSGGIQRLAIDDANELERRGHEVYLVTFEKPENVPDMYDELKIPRDRIAFIPYPRMRSISGFIRLVSFFKQLRPGALVTHHWFANTVGRLAAYASGVPCVVAFEHSTYDSVNPGKQFLFDRLLQYGSRIVAVSSSVRDSLVKNGIQSKRITVIPNGFDASRFSAPHKMRSGSFLFLGRLVGDKGADIAIRALARVPDVSLTIAGDGPERVLLEKLARDEGIADRILFAGTVKDSPRALSEAFALVMPSRREGFGIAALEARAAGTPVIAAAVGGLPELIQDGINGLLVPPGDIAALADAMERLKGDHALYDTLCRGASAGLENFSISRHAEQLEKMIVCSL